MRINKNHILTVDKYIYEALYNRKSGYYMNDNPFGKNGDYITAPNISILFSEMIAIWIILFWKNLKKYLLSLQLHNQLKYFLFLLFQSLF